MEKILLKLKEVCYLTIIDKSDYDIVHILTKEKPTEEQIKNFVQKHFKDYDIKISAIIYKVFRDEAGNLKEFNCPSPLNELKEWPLLNFTNLDPFTLRRNHIAKSLERFEIDMSEFLNTQRKIQLLEEKWNEYCNNLFSFNGRNVGIDKDVLKEIKKFLEEIEKIS